MCGQYSSLFIESYIYCSPGWPENRQCWQRYNTLSQSIGGTYFFEAPSNGEKRISTLLSSAMKRKIRFPTKESATRQSASLDYLRINSFNVWVSTLWLSAFSAKLILLLKMARKGFDSPRGIPNPCHRVASILCLKEMIRLISVIHVVVRRRLLLLSLVAITRHSLDISHPRGVRYRI